MVNSTVAKMYETTLTTSSIEEFSEYTIIEARDIFQEYKELRVIYESTNFEDTKWYFCDEYSNVSMNFVISKISYKKNYESIFGISYEKFVLYLKSFIMLNMGKNVLVSLAGVVRDIKKIISKEISILFSGDVKIQHINSAIDFFSILPVRISEKHEDLLNALDVIEECQFLSRTNKKRNLASFQTYFKFNDILNDYWEKVTDMEEKMFFYPLYLWWQVTAILPLRPREFILTPRDCLSKSNKKFFLSLRRNLLKGSSEKVHYSIEKDYVIVKYEIPQKMYEEILFYQNMTENYENNNTNTLFRAEPHYKYFNQKKQCNSRFYTYVNLRTCLRIFYENVVFTQYHMHLLHSTKETIEWGDNAIEYLHLGDTRHIAMINIIAEGGTPTTAMLLAGHADITISSHYFSNISQLIECKTYEMYKKTKESTEFVLGNNYYPLAPKAFGAFLPLEGGARCYSKEFQKGNVIDCENSIGPCSEIGYCPNCKYYWKNGFTHHFQTTKKFNSQIKADTTYLLHMLKKYRSGLGFEEDLTEALLKLQTSLHRYQEFCLNKLIEREEYNTNGQTTKI